MRSLLVLFACLLAAAEEPAAPALPKLLDLGAHRCIPCQQMAPIIKDLQENHAKQFTTVFIDVWKDPEAGRKYHIQSIPTQIFFDAKGNELGRHVGFLSKEEIFAAWRRFGHDFGPPAAAAPAQSD